MFSAISFSPKPALPSPPPTHHTTPPRLLTSTAKHRQRRVWFQHRVISSIPSSKEPQYFTSVGYQLQPQTCTPFPFPQHHTTPPRLSTSTAKSRQRRVWFQHCVTSSIPSSRVPQYFTSVGYQLQPQTCTPFLPHPHHTTPPRLLTATAKSRQRRPLFQHRVTSSMLSSRVPQYFTSVGYHLQHQSCPPFPPPIHHTAAPLDRYGEV